MWLSSFPSNTTTCHLSWLRCDMPSARPLPYLPSWISACIEYVVNHNIFVKMNISHVRPNLFPNVSFIQPRRLVLSSCLPVKCSSPRRANLRDPRRLTGARSMRRRGGFGFLLFYHDTLLTPHLCCEMLPLLAGWQSVCLT